MCDLETKIALTDTGSKILMKILRIEHRRTSGFIFVMFTYSKGKKETLNAPIESYINECYINSHTNARHTTTSEWRLF